MTGAVFEPRASASGRRRSESGFALLLIFVLAAGIAIFMLNQIPRVCFETQRDREEMLIERGEQYKRAIGLYIRKWNRYPVKIEDLENTNNIRYLRRRYIDPMTGKDEWRIIHAGPGGVLTDSLVQKAGANIGPDGKPIQAGMPGASGLNQAGGMNVNPGNTAAAGTDPNQPPEVNAAVKARPSDRPIGQPGSGQFGMPQPGQPGYDPNQPSDPANQAYNPNYNPYYGFSATPPGTPGAATNQLPGQPGAMQPGQPGYVQPGQPGYQQTGQPPFTQPGIAPPIPPTAYPGQPGVQPQNGVYSPQQYPPVTPQTNASQMIQQLLTQPRQMPTNLGGAAGQAPGGTFGGATTPGGFGGSSGGFGGSTGGGFGGSTTGGFGQSNASGLSPGPTSSFNNNQSGGGGIAGVATKFKGPSIKIYAERQKYQEWEFVYDPQKEAMKLAGGLGQPQQVTGNQPGGPLQSGSGQSGSQSGLTPQSGFGSQSGFGQTGAQSGFGQPSSQPPPPPAN
jgi:hypothetical protein